MTPIEWFCTILNLVIIVSVILMLIAALTGWQVAHIWQEPNRHTL